MDFGQLSTRLRGGAPAQGCEPSWRWRLGRRPRFPGVVCQPCTQDQIETPAYQALARALIRRALMHRKQWEWCYIVQALQERGMARPGVRGVGFGVGTEPITAYLASHGCSILATDLPGEKGEAEKWMTTDEHASGLVALNQEGLCDPGELDRLVEFRPVDMRHVPSDIEGFDFCWSSCALEHLGTLEAGVDFVWRSLELVRPGGVVVHTTEYNVSSNEDTVREGGTVAYRRRDLAGLGRDLRAAGHDVDMKFRLGTKPHDRHVDELPFTPSHLKVELEGFVITSYGLVIRRGPSRTPRTRARLPPRSG